MNVRNHDNIHDFLDAASAFLCADEARNNLVLSIAQRIVDGFYNDFTALTVTDDRENIVRAALMTPPHRLLLSAGCDESLRALFEAMQQQGLRIPGVIAVENDAEKYISLLQQYAGKAIYENDMNMLLYLLEEVEMPAAVNGNLHQAAPDDAGWLSDWMYHFAVDSRLPEHERKKDRDKVLKRIHAGQLFYWQHNGQPVSVCGFAPVTENGVRLGSVYTPPELRGNGYASACVAQMSQQLIDQGKWCCLFTDTTNPTSNKIYQNIGYKEHCRFREYKIDLA